MKFLLTFLMLPMVLGGCSGGDSSSTSSGRPVDHNGKKGTVLAAPIIENEDLTAGLKGVDADNNGIRDDIDRLIEKKYSTTPALKAAAEQDARALQKLMEATTKKEVFLAANEMMRATSCVGEALPNGDPESIKIIISMSKELPALTANTHERFVAYWHANELAGGSVFNLPDEFVCD